MFDPCIYLKEATNSIFGWIILVLYVDDMLICAKERAEVDKLKEQLSQEFRMKDLGSAKKILGMEILRDMDGGNLWLSQRGYYERILKRFNIEKSKVVTLPLAPHFKLSLAMCPCDEKEKELMSKVPYESAVGTLMYLMVCTRPDLAYAMSKVSRYLVRLIGKL